MSRPILLLDVDGVLAPFTAAGGYRPVDLGDLGVLALDLRANRRRLRELAAVCDIVWCTAREQDAAQIIGPAHGLSPDLPHVHFGTIRRPGEPIIVPANPAGGSWKLPRVRAWAAESAAGRAVLWLDDDLGEDVDAWAVERTRALAPTLAVRVNPEIGLDDLLVDVVVRLARDPERAAARLSGSAEAAEDLRF